MQLSTLFCAAASIASVIAQAPFTNSSSSAVQVSTSATSSAPATQSSGPAGIVASFNLAATFNGQTGSFQLQGTSLVFISGLAPSSGVNVSLTVSAQLYVGTSVWSVGPARQSAKRQAASPVYPISVATTVAVGAFTQSFSNSGNVLSLTNSGVSYSFGVTSANVLVVYSSALGVPTGVTAITVAAVNVVTAPTTSSTTSTGGTSITPGGGTSTSSTGTFAVAPVSTTTVTATAVQVNVGVAVSVSVVITIIPLGAPLSVSNVIAVTINGVTYYITQTTVVNALTSTLSVNGVACPTSVATVQLCTCPLQVPAVQVVTNDGKVTTLVGVVNTVGVVTSTVNAGAAQTTTITVRSSEALIIATQTIAITKGAAVVTVGAGAQASVGASVSVGAAVSVGGSTGTSTGSGATVPKAVSSSTKVGVSAFAFLAVLAIAL